MTRAGVTARNEAVSWLMGEIAPNKRVKALPQERGRMGTREHGERVKREHPSP